jgi:DNA-binding Xre family transcriptional regulator
MTDVKSVGQWIPKSLDEIIRERRDECSLRLSTNEDIATLRPMVTILNNAKQIRATISEWRIICLTLPSGKSHILTGINESTNDVWATSALKSIDFENNLVLTDNSIYRLGSKGEGEPHLSILLHICYILHLWGLGERLGVPQIFY